MFGLLGRNPQLFSSRLIKNISDGAIALIIKSNKTEMILRAREWLSIGSQLTLSSACLIKSANLTR